MDTQSLSLVAALAFLIFLVIASWYSIGWICRRFELSPSANMTNVMILFSPLLIIVAALVYTMDTLRKPKKDDLHEDEDLFE